MKFKHNRAKAMECLREIGDQVVAKKDLKIVFPKRWVERELALVETEIFVYGLFPIIDSETGEYGHFNVCSFVELGQPYSNTTVVIDGVDYIELTYREGDLVIVNLVSLKRGDLSFRIFDELLVKAKVPWYVSYDEFIKFLDTAKDMAGSDLANIYEIIEALVSIVGRDAFDRKKYIRNVAKDKVELNSKVDYVALGNVLYSVKGATNKLIGSYFEEALVSNLTEKSTEASPVERVLKGRSVGD